MIKEEINRIKYIVCCPMCDNEKCVRKTDKCEAEIWAKRKIREKANQYEFTGELKAVNN